MGKRDGERHFNLGNLGWIALAAAVVIIVVVVAGWWPGSSDSDQQSVVVPREGESEVPVQTAESNRLPPLVLRYQKGDVLESNSTYALWEQVVGADGVNHAFMTDYMLHQGDVVLVTGQTTLFGHEGWFLPIHVHWGGVYTEGLDWFISNDADLYETTLADRPEPDVVVGERVRLNWNFIARLTPAGEPIGLDFNGNPLLVYGGEPASILEGPTIGIDLDADGGTRYWCKIHAEWTDRVAYVSCEFQK